MREAACWAHLRRDFHDEWSRTKSAITREAPARIGALYDIEREITGRPADIRLAARQINRLDELLPWNWSPCAVPNAEAA